MLQIKTGPNAGSYSGLYIPDPTERKACDEMNEGAVSANIFEVWSQQRQFT